MKLHDKNRPYMIIESLPNESDTVYLAEEENESLVEDPTFTEQK